MDLWAFGTCVNMSQSVKKELPLPGLFQENGSLVTSTELGQLSSINFYIKMRHMTIC